MNRYRKNLDTFLGKKEEDNLLKQQQTINLLKGIVDELIAEFPALSSLIVVGSVAKGRVSESSDVDIIVGGIKGADFFRLHGYLERHLKIKVDLIDDDKLTESERDHITRSKEVVYEKKGFGR